MHSATFTLGCIYTTVAMRRTIGILLVTLYVTGASAHETWLRPQGAGKTLSVELTSGERFGKAELAAASDRVTRAEYRLQGTTKKLGTPQAERRLLRFPMSVSGTGIAAVWVSLATRVVDLDDKQVSHYLDEIRAPDHLRKAWNEAGPARRWRESFSQHMKTFVRFGNPADDRSWSVPVGQPLEIVPQSDPTMLRAGETLTVRVMEDGKPLPFIQVACIAGTGKVHRLQATDRAGQASCPVATGGFWLVRAVELRRSRTQGADWESHWAILTVEVRL